MGNKIDQIGPSQLNICKGCTELNTHRGTWHDHHRCHDEAWPSIKATKFREFPITPDTCPYV